MIQMPRRSVTRFFIPLIDVLILLFAMFLLMPLVQATGENGEGSSNQPLSAAERRELFRLREEKRHWDDLERMRQELARLRQEKVQVLQQRLAVRVLQIDDQGRLLYYDPLRPLDRSQEVTVDTAPDLIRRQRETVGDHELYFLILGPRPAAGLPRFPRREDIETYDKWFKDVAHGYDIPMK